MRKIRCDVCARALEVTATEPHPKCSSCGWQEFPEPPKPKEVPALPENLYQRAMFEGENPPEGGGL